MRLITGASVSATIVKLMDEEALSTPAASISRALVVKVSPSALLAINEKALLLKAV